MVFINTKKARQLAIKEQILVAIKSTSMSCPMSVTEICERLRSLLPYSVTFQQVNALLGQMIIAPRQVVRVPGGMYYIYTQGAE